MGYWGVKSYENDEAADALDAAFERVHEAVYEELMDDRNPLTPEQIQAKLAGPETLAAAVEVCRETFGDAWDDWEEVEHLGFVGVVVRHAELGVPINDEWRDRALEWLRDEPIEWDEATARKLRRQKEIELLGRSPRAGAEGGRGYGTP
jgi:hypothetical protein